MSPLVDYLAEQPTTSVTLTLAEIETLLGRPLPRSVYTQSWWSATRHRIVRQAWVRAGWMVAAVDLRAGARPAVTFVRAVDE